MPVVAFGNESVVETYKPDEGTNATKLRHRKALGRRITTMHLNEVDGPPPGPAAAAWEERPSTSMNVAMAIRFWAGESDKAPAWVESTDELLAQLLAQHFDCPVGRPKSWKEDA